MAVSGAAAEGWGARGKLFRPVRPRGARSGGGRGAGRGDKMAPGLLRRHHGRALEKLRDPSPGGWGRGRKSLGGLRGCI